MSQDEDEEDYNDRYQEEADGRGNFLKDDEDELPEEEPIEVGYFNPDEI